MRRHPAFHDLGRDHHVMLTLALGIDRAATGARGAKPAREAVAALASFWRGGLAAHLDEEEALLSGVLAGAGPPLAGLGQEMRRGHAALRAAGAGLEQAPSLEAGEGEEEAARPPLAVDDAPPRPLAPGVLEAARLLRAHVRWQEAVLFPALQALPEDVLASLAEADARLRKAAGRPTGPGRACDL